MRQSNMAGLCLGAIALILSVCNAFAGDRFALLIGNSRYERAVPLSNPENDVAMVGEALTAAGFEVETYTNLVKADLSAKLQAFFTRTDRPDSTVLLYFAGHGLQLRGENYFLPIDVDLEDDAVAIESAISVETVLRSLDSSRARNQILVLDACRDDPFAAKTRGAVAVGLKKEEVRKNRMIAFSTAPGTKALDGDAGNSPFASAFAESIVVPGLSLQEAMTRVRLKVLERTHNRQEPWESSSLSERVELVPLRSAALSAEEEVWWDRASMVETAESYQRYMERFPHGNFTEIAKLKIKAINSDQSYFRRRQTFPIVLGDFFETGFCGERGEDHFGERSRDIDTFGYLGELDGQVAFVKLDLPLAEFVCGGSANSIREIPGDGTPERCPLKAEVKRIVGSLPKGRKVPCERIAADEEDEWNVILARTGGGVVLGRGGMTVMMSTLSTDYWRFEINLAEGDFSDAAVSIEGFARIRYGAAEVFTTVFLEPYDPRSDGMSQRGENTRDRVRAKDGLEEEDVFRVGLALSE